jgi:hypothetical protein
LLIVFGEKLLQWFEHVKRIEKTRILTSLELNLKGRNPWDDPDQDGSARYWKTS